MEINERLNVSYLLGDSELRAFVQGYYACMQDGGRGLTDVTVFELSDILQYDLVTRALEVLGDRHKDDSHQVFKELVLSNQSLSEEVKELRGLLKEANRRYLTS